MNRPDPFSEFKTKMRAAGSSPAAIQAFHHAWSQLTSGNTGFLPENSIQPVTTLPHLDDINPQNTRPDLLAQTVIVKLNGGLGTSMGLETAKSLLPIKNGLTFLDLIARQILHLRQRCALPARFLLMNSFSTSADTRAFLERYPELGPPDQLELMQNAVPKVDAQTFRPAARPQNPQLEWCPPGHGDLYPSLLGSGWLDRLLSDNVKYLFVSNSDNLGANLDLQLLSLFAESGAPFLMEVAERTAADKKGGHLALRNGRLILRESAQCPDPDQAAFQDITRHRFFNTNNLWVRLDALKARLESHGGFLPLPIIQNVKTIDPRDKTSPRVVQLESAMGAAIECFDNAAAIRVPRARFAPVKTTADLLALRSDAYQLTSDWRIIMAPQRNQIPPAIDLDPNHYKLVEQLDHLTPNTPPSLVECNHLSIRGPFTLEAGIIFKGAVHLKNHTTTPRAIPPGVYHDTTLEFP